ncbi:hypothetical protein [Rhodococcus sp. NPDC049939]|uniref:hypothetical protein n=1 Tax=Rhodococcus sp. NPDC049939 TaxID=3155511 RepID=UPI0033D9782F
MTIQVSSTETRPARADKRSGAAERAYEKRSRRASAHGSSAVAASGRNRTAFAARIPFVATIIGLLGLGLVTTLLLTTRSAEDSYQLSAARAHNQFLAQEKAALQRDVETANSAPKLAEEAAKLGMVPAKDPARLVVHEDGSVEVVGTPAPASGSPVPPLDVVAPSTNEGVLVPVAPSRDAAASSRPATTETGGDTEMQARGEQLVPVMPSSSTPSTVSPGGHG